MRRTLLLTTALLAAVALPAIPALPAQALPDRTGPAQAAPDQALAPDGTLTLRSASVKAGDPIELSYSTPRPNPTNWIGLYTDPGNGPVAEKYVGPSLTWVYIPAATGTATLPTDGLEPGDYVAYALAEDGYAWLAQPVRMKVVSSEPVHFVTGRFTLRNARAKTPYTASVTGTVRGQATFRKVSGPAWLRVRPDGGVTGTPPS